MSISLFMLQVSSRCLVRWIVALCVAHCGVQVLAPARAAAQDSEFSQERARYIEAWRKRFQHAREQLLAQNDEAAAREFDELAYAAPTVEDRRVAEEFAKLARARLALKPKPSVSPHIRTSDELSVLYSTAFAYGFGTSAWVALETQPKTFAAAVLPFIGLTTASVGGVALVDSYRPFRLGVPHSIAGGMLLGFGEAAWLVGYQHAVATRRDNDSHWDSPAVARLLWAGTTLGGAAGGLIGALREPTPGRVSFTSSAALWSGLVTSFAAAAIQPEQRFRTETAFAVGAVGYNAGLVSGALLAPRYAPSVARVRFTDLGGLGGSLLGISSYLLIAGSDSEPRGGLAAAALGSAAGLGIAWWATSDMSRDLRPTPRTTILGSLRPQITPLNQGWIAGVSGTL